MQPGLCVESSLNPYHNLAVEELLCQRVRENEFILYLWQNENTVVIGKNQNAFQECNFSEMSRDNILLARRKTGGGAVFHDAANLNFTFITSRENEDIPRNCRIILNALDSIGIKANLSGRNDMECNGRKFSGSAYYKGKSFACHHGTLMVGVDMQKLGQYLRPSVLKLRSRGVASVRSRVINLSRIESSLTIDLLKDKLIESFQNYCENVADKISFSSDEIEIVKQKENFFASKDWILGHNPGCSLLAEKRFNWGIVHLIKDSSGIIYLYTDALEMEIVEYLQGYLLKGEKIPYPSSNLLNPSQLQIFEDITGLLSSL